jgi:hypothetical protein
VIAPQCFLAMPLRAHPFAARSFEERQVLRVIHDTTGVGIFPINANGMAEHALRKPRNEGHYSERARYGEAMNSRKNSAFGAAHDAATSDA